MLLLAALVATAAWSYGFAQTIPVQSPLSFTKSKGSVNLQCHFKDSSQDFGSTVIHWYQHKEAEHDKQTCCCWQRLWPQPLGLASSQIPEFQLMTAFLLFSSLDGFAQTIPVQRPLSFTTSKGSVNLECHFEDSSQDFGSTVIHWYQQKEGKAPERFLYLSATQKVDDGFEAKKYRAEKFPRQKLCILTINDLIQDDTATYYCAYRYSHCGRNSEITETSTSLASQPQTT
ncbi:hypothetical protein QYF61_014383 [Mycteria americana]|uniref:Ig-like domain-containing protein n=1 Tax=Mycteria americana TaxID=33587 RepID=A0AAN7S3J1_MYCAM|nr:hypothetical protein QYF61_014383 [Mycteria americana]